MNEIKNKNYDDKYDNITLTSSHKNNKQRTNIKLEKEEDLSDSINTITNEEIKNINIKNLHSINKYTLKALKTLATFYGIAHSEKALGGKWKALNKGQLYEKVKSHLQKSDILTS
jgi:hypothetical protein